MANKVTVAFESAGDWLREQGWYQQARGKWDELDPQNRLYIQIALAAAVFGTLLLLLLSAQFSVRSLGREVAEKRDLLTLLQSSSEELRKLRDARGMMDAAPAGPWPAYFQSLAGPAGLDAAAITVSAEKAGTKTDLATEALIDLSLKKVSVRQVVKLAYGIENGPRPVKIRQLLIDTKADPEGYMDATLSVSAFTWVAPQ